MRNEIMQVSTKQNSLLIVSFTVSGYAFSNHAKPGLSASFYAFTSLALCGLGILYCDCDRAVIRCARYIHKSLRPRIWELGGRDGCLLKWEEYIRDESVTVPVARKGKASRQNKEPSKKRPDSPLPGAVAASFIFVPALLSLGLFFVEQWMPILRAPSSWKWEHIGLLVVASSSLLFLAGRIAQLRENEESMNNDVEARRTNPDGSQVLSVPPAGS